MSYQSIFSMLNANGMKRVTNSKWSPSVTYTASDSVISIPWKGTNLLAKLENYTTGWSMELVCKNLTIPNPGVSFNNSDELMFFPQPKVDMPSCSLTMYVPQRVEGWLRELYLSQFCNGLLSLDQLDTDYRIQFSYTTQEFPKGAVFDNITLARALEEATNLTAQGIAQSTLSSPFSSMGTRAATTALNNATLPLDSAADIYRQAMASIDVAVPFLELRGCHFSSPTTELSVEDESFVTMTMQVDYSNFKDIRL